MGACQTIDPARQARRQQAPCRRPAEADVTDDRGRMLRINRGTAGALDYQGDDKRRLDPSSPPIPKQKGLMYNLTLEGSKISRIYR
jgi:hypothetical protein